MSDALRQGNIVLVPLPFSDLSAVKRRPAVVVSNQKFKGEDVIICAMTSQRAGYQEARVSDDDLDEGKLPVVSYVRYGKVFSIDRNLIWSVTAKIGKKKLSEIIAGLIGLVENI